MAYLLDGTDDQRAARRQRLRDALAGFDAATIATTHQFCQLVLRSLGVAGDTAASVTLLDSLDDLVTEIVDDLYLAHFGQERDDPALHYPRRCGWPARWSTTRRPSCGRATRTPIRGPPSASGSPMTFWPSLIRASAGWESSATTTC